MLKKDSFLPNSWSTVLAKNWQGYRDMSFDERAMNYNQSTYMKVVQ